MYTTIITSESNLRIVVVNIYLVIGIMITMLMYDKLVIELKRNIEENQINFVGLTVTQLNNLIKYIPLAMILVWPIFIIGFVQGFIEAMIREISSNFK